jgi:8-oxo-dGTP diphosphatase
LLVLGRFKDSTYLGVVVNILVSPLTIGLIRIGSHGSGMLALPGGHLEMFETWEECAKREVEEETGLEIGDIQFAHVTNDIMAEENRHYVTIFMIGKCIGEGKSNMPQNKEPHKCKGWQSFSWDELKNMLREEENSEMTLFGPLKRLVEDEPQRVLKFLQCKT